MAVPVSLDTSAVVDLIEGEPAVTLRLRQHLARGESVLVSAIVLEELEFGAALSGSAERERRKVQAALVGLRIEAMLAEDARGAGRHRAKQQQAGRKLGAYDGLIAGHAHARGWTLVTSDAGLLKNAIELAMVNWRDPA